MEKAEAERGLSRWAWWRYRLWLSCVLVGGCLLLGGGTVRAVAVFTVFRPFPVELEQRFSAAERLQSYRIAAAAMPYVWAGGVLFFVGVAGSVGELWRRLRAHGWLFMAAVLAFGAMVAELWLLLRFDVPLVRLFAAGDVAVQAVEQLVLERVRVGGVAATLATCAEWTVFLLFVWRPLEKRADEAGAISGGAA